MVSCRPAGSRMCGAQGRRSRAAGLFRLHGGRVSGIDPARVPSFRDDACRMATTVPFKRRRWPCPPTR
ncbi:hypothetical protein DEW08_23865 (plasmid) [Azospirillum thermophilum]|uniref:Uncharacterized protein n=1 Tax=Azospirillum thermophilum TaxID=2202148 RepID=A0A2S2CXQ7_9PROT|nr:hypothetical protein DEW08_23865 [Azospirillum thermophilum]